MDIDLLLNFPKIKKLEVGVERLVAYLMLYHQENKFVNYELSQDRTRIRKRPV
jgi:hypothetical protein